ncbi:hypothetical protein AZ270_gp74 [Acidianus tailed spindle virus]|uniref:hypothetical protein n=1 Tax=Acidianus tailed spindle virus TaxID=1797140 RepID=UPI00076F3386|nr:hypothetical protein AZ270_gp74 [Acidianus tailed spindle virus]AME30097.1 hypothetical protein ATSV_A56 [Acidianus tailed spindle virus]
MNNTKLFFDQQGGEWGQDSRGGYAVGGDSAVTPTGTADTAEVDTEMFKEIQEVVMP